MTYTAKIGHIFKRRLAFRLSQTQLSSLSSFHFLFLYLFRFVSPYLPLNTESEAIAMERNLITRIFPVRWEIAPMF